VNRDVKIPMDTIDTICDVIGRLDAISLLLCNSQPMTVDVSYLGDVIYHLLDPLRQLIARPSDGEEETS